MGQTRKRKGQRVNILVTGSAGFLGKHLVSHLGTLGHYPYCATRSAYDLRNPDHLDALFRHTGKPDIIFHLAANVGGIQYNLANPGAIFYDNVMMTTQLIHRAMERGCGKFIMVGSVCSYPCHVPIPAREHHLWTGYPEPSNGAYGVAKLIALTQLQAYRDQYGLDFAYPILSNLYGPGDNFDDAKSHVIPALIKRFTSDEPQITVWGDGTPTRDFLYVEDAVRALVACMDADCPLRGPYLSCREPLNISGGVEISIRRVIELLNEITGYSGKVEFDQSKPNGQLRRGYDNYKAQQTLGWQPVVDFETGLRATVDWWLSCK